MGIVEHHLKLHSVIPGALETKSKFTGSNVNGFGV